MRPPADPNPAAHWRFAALVFAIAVAAVVSRRPDAFFYAQFYIEDGDHWYANAHEMGALAALTVTHRGYFVAVQALCGMLAAAFPLAQAPLVMALCGAAFNALPAAFLASSRLASWLPSLPLRLFLAFLIVAAPDAWTLTTTATNAMWYLAITACLVVLADPPPTRSWQAFDVVVVALCGLSGPFSVFLLPVAALWWWLRRERFTLVLLAILGATAAIQASSVLATPHPPPMPLGASASGLIALFAKRVVYEALFGQVGGERIMLGAWPALFSHPAGLFVAALIGVVVLAHAAARGPRQLRLFLLFAGAVLAISLFYPGDALGDEVWWRILMPAGNGNRYFLIPAIAFLFACVFAMFSTWRVMRVVGTLLVATALLAGVRLNWHEPAYPDFEFPAALREYGAAVAGTQVPIMTLPDRLMTLTKKASEPVIPDREPCAGELAVAPTLIASNQIRWDGAVGRSEGGDPYAVYALPVRLWVCGVRVRFVAVNPARPFIMLQMFWSETDARGAEVAGGNSLRLVHLRTTPQEMVFHVGRRIDRIRLDPGIEAGLAFELLEVVLLTREAE